MKVILTSSELWRGLAPALINYKLLKIQLDLEFLPMLIKKIRSQCVLTVLETSGW